MSTSQKIVSAVVGLWLVALTGFLFVQNAPQGDKPLQTVAGAISPVTDFQQGVWWFKNAFYIGKTQQFSVSNTGNVVTTGTLTVAGVGAFGSTTPSALGDVVVDGTGTTTIMVSSSGTAKGGCLQLENSSGTLTKAYINGTTWVIAAGSCK